MTQARCIYDLIQDQVARTPNAIALICADAQLTYRELDQRANQLARHLQARGVGAETLVGICVTRSIEMVVGILGILKAGGAYVPLDPSYPQERLAFMLDDARARIVITQSNLLAVVPQRNVETICLDTDWAEIARAVDAPVNRVASPENLAYVMYTSGSTGKPKGVMITHANLAHFVRIAGAALPMTPDDVYLHTASIGYALSVRQLMIPLCFGATIVLATADQARDPLRLFALIKQQRVALMDFVPSFWRTCVQALAALPRDERRELLDNHLRRIVSIGEPLLSDIPHAWTFTLEHNATLVNIFGQTETTGVVATYSIPRDQNIAPGIVPIGTSVPETQLYLLDANLQPVAPDQPGELCVSNSCLARGYLNRPDLTAEKFVPNPFSAQPGARMYRTGDLARYRADGSIEFLGRGDYQVKIRGQRLELGEVEAVLNAHPGVATCVALARGEQPDDKMLVAYIVRKPNQVLGAPALREFMRQRVPDYMLPAAFVFLDALPLTPNGKVNRLALPAPMMIAESTADDARAFIAPRTRVEKILAAIWRELLKLDRVSVEADFFNLGGHSLMAVRMFTRIEQSLGIRFPITALFRAPTIAQLAEVIERRDPAALSWSPLVPIRATGTQPPLFGVHGLYGDAWVWRDLVAQIPADQPFYAIQAKGINGVEPALTRIEEMASLYLQEIRKVQPRGPYYLGGYSMGGEVAFEIAQQLSRAGARVALLVMFDTVNPARAIRSVVTHQHSETVSIHAPTPDPRQVNVSKRKLAAHLRRLSKLKPREQLAYIRHDLWIRIQRVGTYALVKGFRLFGARLPDGLLREYLRETHQQAIRDYLPDVYPGKITLFRARASLETSPSDSPFGWKPLAGGGLEEHFFDTTHRIIAVEYAAAVGRQLNECLRAARGEENRE
ncbi:MAG: amino acid adenylation domain-containing protein [Chloroflexi bacterium]|nr:amino acid adenylation domain-containing protein [Chloroflexota bacterium]